MFATNTHLLIGMPKCGCIYATRVLASAFGRNWLAAGTVHAPLCTIPPNDYLPPNHRTIVGMIRNPFAWYYSRWAYFYFHAPDSKRYEFPEYFARHYMNPHGPIGKKVEAFPSCDIIGAFTYMHVAYHCHDANKWLGGITTAEQLADRYDETLGPTHMMRTERLTDDVIKTFGMAVVSHLEQFRNSMSDVKKPYQEAYTPTMRRQVEDADGWLLERYGYSLEE